MNSNKQAIHTSFNAIAIDKHNLVSNAVGYAVCAFCVQISVGDKRKDFKTAQAAAVPLRLWYSCGTV